MTIYDHLWPYIACGAPCTTIYGMPCESKCSVPTAMQPYALLTRPCPCAMPEYRPCPTPPNPTPHPDPGNRTAYIDESTSQSKGSHMHTICRGGYMPCSTVERLTYAYHIPHRRRFTWTCRQQKAHLDTPHVPGQWLSPGRRSGRGRAHWPRSHHGGDHV